MNPVIDCMKQKIMVEDDTESDDQYAITIPISDRNIFLGFDHSTTGVNEFDTEDSCVGGPSKHRKMTPNGRVILSIEERAGTEFPYPPEPGL